MELRPGYKRTEVGVIPEEWEVKPMGELGQVRTGPFGTLLKADEYAGTDGVPLISVGEIGEGSFRVTDKTPRVPAKVVRRLPQYVLKTGDIVFGRKGAVDRSALVGPSQHGWFLGSDGISLRLNGACDPSYVAWQFQRPAVRAWLIQNAVGTTMASLNQKVLAGVTVPWAPSTEQRAIATALSDVDALLTQLDRLIAKKRDIKQAAMQQLLTGKTRLPGFDAPWSSVKAGEIGRFRGGSGFPMKFQGSSTDALPFYKVSDMNTPGNEVFMSQANNYISSEIRAKLSATLFPPMTIVFAKVGAAIFLERKKMLRFASCLDNNMAGYVPEPGIIDPRYLHYVFMSMALSDLVSTTALPSLNNRVLAGMIFRLPPVDEQTAIATILSDLDTELAALEARRDKTRALKQGMMQELLTGRTRLV